MRSQRTAIRESPPLTATKGKARAASENPAQQYKETSKNEVNQNKWTRTHVKVCACSCPHTWGKREKSAQFKQLHKLSATSSHSASFFLSQHQLFLDIHSTLTAFVQILIEHLLYAGHSRCPCGTRAQRVQEYPTLVPCSL